ncbi:inositol monophosphatase family protein [Maribellus maritimus]|uniref:inositol monophosphatase family protein n=1 Tax=Maribellus maritimus TaxID=2870838 RepID=UPI001EEB7ADD|nr:inositol monophosphatase [Maribellus maritimus]MCG6185982.1 inositol monophosphatase [Maribellus maritimus]
MLNLSNDLETALKAARAAATIIEKNYNKTQNSSVKDGSKGLVTETDLEADRAIVKILTENSTYPILSEESGVTGNSDGPIWVIDPLDGTNNFARSIPLFGVSIGLMSGKESLIGVIIDPVHKKEYYATKRGGAFCNGKPITLPLFDTEYIPMIFLNHGYDENHRGKFKKFTAATASSYNTLKLGTTAIELIQVASGAVDGFICVGDELWDFAAGMVITQEAGCVFTDWQGKTWDGKNSQLLVTRPEIHEDLVERLKFI